MLNKKMIDLGQNRSAIRDLFEFGKELGKKIGKENVFDFTLGNPAVPCPSDVNEYAAKLITTNPQGTHSYTSAQGDLETRKAIVEYNKNKYGFELDENLIYMTCGAAAALAICCRSIISSSDDEIIVIPPFFPEYKVFIENAGGKIKPAGLDTNSFEINFEDLSKNITVNTQGVIINSPNNPSGVVYSEETIKKLANLLNEKEKEFGHPIYLLTDEPYREILFDGVKCPFVPSYYNNTIICYSFSKALSVPGERIGYIAVSPNATDKELFYAAVCGSGRSLGYVCAPSLFQKVVAKHASTICSPVFYLENRDLLIDMLTKFGFSCVNPKGAFYLFVKSPDGDGKSFSDKAKQLGLLIVPSDSFGVDGYVRLATCVSKETIFNSKNAFEKLAKLYNLI